MTSVRILIVDNIETTAADLQKRLERMGYIVAGTAKSSEEALNKTRELNPDIILMNIKLRESRDGIKTGELIHSNHRKPILYITPSASQDTIQRTGSAGTFGYIFPLMDERQMFAMIETAVSRNKLENELDNSRQWLSGILNSIGDGVIAMDGQGRIQFINLVAQELTGWSQSEASNRTIYEVCRLVDERSFELINLAGEDIADQSRTALLIPRDGNAVPVETNINLVKTDTGAMTGIVLAFRDVTQHRNALKEIELQAQKAKILEKSASVLNTDLDAKFVLAKICDLTNNAFNAYATAVFLYAKEMEAESEIVIHNTRGKLSSIEAASLRIPGNLLETLITSESPIHIENDVSKIEYFPDPALLQNEKIKTVVIAGIYRHENLMGVLITLFPASRDPLQNDELELLGGLIDQAANSLTNASLFKQVRLGRERHRRLAKSLVDVQEGERRHIAGELHDHLGQLLTGLQFMLETVKSQADTKIKPGIEDIQNSVSEIIQQVREMSLNLRPSMLDDLGLVPTLQWHFDRYTRQTGILINFLCDKSTNRFPLDIETAAYRIIQEALTNVARYAQVKSVFVGLAIQQEALWVEVVDKGKGFDASAILEKPTSGLGGMRERAELAGGYLVVRSLLDQGTQVIAALPIKENRIERRKYVRKNSPG